jgi:hypothetical protein
MHGTHVLAILPYFVCNDKKGFSDLLALRRVEYAVRFGCNLGLIRPSTRYHIEVPWIDPSWVFPPPPEAVRPREVVCYRSQTKGTGLKRVSLVRLKAGKLYLLE